MKKSNVHRLHPRKKKSKPKAPITNQQIYDRGVSYGFRMALSLAARTATDLIEAGATDKIPATIGELSKFLEDMKPSGIASRQKVLVEKRQKAAPPRSLILPGDPAFNRLPGSIDPRSVPNLDGNPILPDPSPSGDRAA